MPAPGGKGPLHIFQIPVAKRRPLRYFYSCNCTTMEKSKIPVIIVGANAEGRIVLDIANLLDVLVYRFISDEEKYVLQELNDTLVVSQLGNKDSDTLLSDENVKVVLAERSIPRRKKLVKALKKFPAELINAIHPASQISPYAKLGRGCIISHGVVIQANAMVGSFNLIETYTSIEPDAVVGDYCTIQSGVRIGREAQIGDEVFIGSGAVIQAGVHVGSNAVVGAGAVVLLDVEPESTVFGNPAKSMKE